MNVIAPDAWERPRAELSPLPVNIEAEQAVLGTLLMDNAAFAAIAGIVEAEHFHDPLHARVFEAAQSLIEARQVASPITLKAHFSTQELVPGIDVATYLARLAGAAMPGILVAQYARHVRDMALRRQLIEQAEALAGQAREAAPSDDPAALAGSAITALQKVAATGRLEDTRREPGASAAAILARARRIMLREERDEGISTGIPDIDRDTGGFQPGTLWLVGGRPGQGKTILATGFAAKVAGRGEHGVMLFSLELGEQQIMARFLSDLAYRRERRIVYKQIVTGDLNDTELWCLESAQKRLADMPLVIDVASRLTVAEIGARVRAEKARMARRGIRLGVVLIDYLKMVAASDRYRGQRVYEVGEISGGLKQLAKDEGLCVVLLTQLNRASVSHDRKDKRPALSDLRESGDLEADADVVALIHREAYYIASSSEYRSGDGDATQRFLDLEHEAELIIAKTRLGATNTVKLWCDVGASTFAAQAREGYAG